MDTVIYNYSNNFRRNKMCLEEIENFPWRNIMKFLDDHKS